jgi:hypothetical protein
MGDKSDKFDERKLESLRIDTGAYALGKSDKWMWGTGLASAATAGLLTYFTRGKIQKGFLGPIKEALGTLFTPFAVATGTVIGGLGGSVLGGVFGYWKGGKEATEIQGEISEIVAQNAALKAKTDVQEKLIDSHEKRFTEIIRSRASSYEECVAHSKENAQTKHTL